MAFYPFLLPVWKETYFRPENTTYEVPCFISDQIISEQKEFYFSLSDPHMRSKLLASLYFADNPKFQTFLNELIQKEENPVVLTDILRGLYIKSCTCSNLQILKKMMKSEVPAGRAYSAVLYIDNAKSPDEIFELLKNEKNEFVAKLVWEKLSTKKDLCQTEKLYQLYDKISEIHKPYLLAILAKISVKPEEEKLIRAVIDNKEAIGEKISIAQSLASRKGVGDQILAKFAEDPDARLRAAVAKSEASDARLPFLLKLSRDADNEIRRQAIISLSKFGLASKDAVNALIERLADNELLVRNETENALISLKITEDYLSKISSEKLTDSAALASAVRVIGELKYLPASEEIRKILNETNNIEVRKRALIALGKLEYREAAKDIGKFASDNEKEIRRAVAYALGQLKEKDTFETIVKLASDNDPEVSAEASIAIFKTADPFFENVVISNLKRVKDSFLIRSAGAKAASTSCINSANAVNALKRIALEKVIPTDMGPTFDSDHSRASAAWALADIAKANAKFAKDAASILEKLQTPPEKQDDKLVSSEFLIDCARQAQAYLEGKEATQSEITPYMPELAIRKIERN